LEKTEKVGAGEGEPDESIVSAAEFILEGLHAHKRIGRTEDRVFTAGEKPARGAERESSTEQYDSDWTARKKNRRPFN
jgi:magnesium chelatase subunit I